jgi:hypothetical protein
LIIGYDDNKKCWICQNSWGAKGNPGDGYFQVGYGQCDIDTDISVIGVVLGGSPFLGISDTLIPTGYTTP